MTEKEFSKLKVGNVIIDNLSKSKYTIIDKDELGIVLSNGYYYLAKDLINFTLIKKKMNKRVSKKLRLEANMFAAGKSPEEKKKIYKRLKSIHKEIKKGQ